MSDALRRAVRTFLQAFIGTFLATGILSAAAANGLVDWSVLRKAAVSAAAAGVAAVLTWLMNYLEDRGTVPAVLKATPSAGANPVTQDPVT